MLLDRGPVRAPARPEVLALDLVVGFLVDVPAVSRREPLVGSLVGDLVAPMVAPGFLEVPRASREPVFLAVVRHRRRPLAEDLVNRTRLRFPEL